MIPTDTPHPLIDRGENLERRSVGDHRRKTLLDMYLSSDQTTTLPTQVILEEKPHHITLAYLLAAGRTRAEIGEVLKMDPGTISQIIRQPFFQARLKRITEESGRDLVKAFLENEVLPSLEVLRSVRDNTQEKGTTRVLASNSILDRFLGKPMVHVESKTNLNIHTAAETVDQVQRELAGIDEQLLARGVNLSTKSGTN